MMGVLDKVLSQNGAQVLSAVRDLGLCDFGVYTSPIADMIDSLRSENGEISGVVAALNNADTDGVLLEVLENDPQSVLDGMKIVAHAAGTDNLVLTVPAYAEETAKTVSALAEKEGVSVVTGLVNRRAYKGAVLMHIVAAARVAEAFEGKGENGAGADDGVYLSVNGAKVRKYPADTKVGDLLPNDVKAVRAGYRLLTPEALGSTVGEICAENGVLTGLGQDKCVIATVEDELLKSRRQSCGKCVFCREGLVQLEGMHKDITQGKGKSVYTEITTEIGEAMTCSTPCSMGQKSSEIALCAVRDFSQEYDGHIRRRMCKANACTAFINIYIDPMTCSGCGECIKVCPLDCIDGRPGYIHSIDDYDCTKCGKCMEVCPEKSVVETLKRVPRLPQRITRVGKFKRHF